MTKTQLEKIGLSKKETLVYEALLARGNSTPSQISKDTKLTRELIYHIASLLVEKGLIEEIANRKIKTYRPLPPEKIRSFLKQKREDIETKQDVLESVLPELSNLYKLSSKKSEITYFKGIEGIKTIYKDIFLKTNPGELLVFRSIKDEALGRYVYDHIKLLTEHGIESKILAPKKEKIVNDVDGTKLNREIRYIDDEDFLFPTEIAIHKNSVIFSSFDKEKMGAVIKNKDLSLTLANIFNLLWKQAKK